MNSKIIVTLRGGTRLRMDAGRGPEKPYDKLLVLLDECESWDGDLAGKWVERGTLRAARVEEQQ